MKICAIRLENTRRFTDPVEITGIGPGLNVLSAANEQGKSTIFDALHAVFFKDAKSWDKEIRALAPRAGGEPRIEVEIDLEGQRYRLAKQFRKGSGKGEVRIWQGSQLFLQSDAAEAWLQELIKSPKDGGPAGLLWVRQGLTDFADAKETLAARQDLMSSVTGEVDAITGGQRMDAIRRDVRQSLDRLVTSRGAKKGGALEQAETAVAQLVAREEDFAIKVQQLRAQLDQRQELRAELASLQDPEVQQEQAARLRQAQQDLVAAERYQEKLLSVGQALRHAQLLLDSHDSKLAVFQTRQTDYREAAQACTLAEERLRQVTAALEPVQAEVKTAQVAYANAQQQSKSDEAQLAALQQAERLAQQLQQRGALEAKLGQARQLQQQVVVLKSQAEQGPDQTDMDRIEACQAALDLAQNAQQLAAATLVVSYDSGQEGAFLLNGDPLRGGAKLSLPQGGKITVPGLGAIDLYPGQGLGADQLQRAEEELAAALATVSGLGGVTGSVDLDSARVLFRQRQEALQSLREAEIRLALLAPEGVAALMQQHAELADADLEAAEAPDAAPTSQQLDQAEAALASSRAVLDQAATRRDAAKAQEAELRLGFEAANAHHQAALQRLQRAEVGLAGQEGDAKEALARLVQQRAQSAQDVASAQAQVETLQQAAPDLETARARALRAQSGLETSRMRLQELGRDLAVLDSRIATGAGEAIEEELTEVRGQLVSARQGLAAISFEVAMLRRLDLALEKARGAAQEAYVGPVLQELQPLLRLLWPEARLDVDAGQVLPQHLQRAGQEESFDSLSGGTQEQIALLVRLAFARLLARAGRAAPVILDDAIVYTDDARIEKLFDALTLQAGDMQILVFTCRQKSFRSLGGTQLSIRPTAPVA